MVHGVGYGLLAVTMVIAAVVDCRTGRIPNRLTVTAMVAGLALWIWAGGSSDGLRGAAGGLGQSVLGLACGLLPCAVLAGMGGMGGGDAKLIGAVGALSADWRFVVATVFFGFVVGALFALALMVRHRIVRRTLGRIYLAVVTALGRGRPTLPGDSPRVPMAVALLIGALLAVLERRGILAWPLNL